MNQGQHTPVPKPMIFVVDDEPMLVDLAAALLKPLYDVKTFVDPQAALQAVKACSAPPALVLTDYAMKSLNGLQFIRELRQISPGQKTILVSGTVDETIFSDMASKPNHFIAKPYGARQLIEAVAAVLAD
jgi:CheY-like chemotaxis protein